MSKPELPDGYAWVDGGPAIRLVDPQWCPAGHPAVVVRRDLPRCEQHRYHHAWTCRCGQAIYRHDGEFVGVLGCVTRNYGQQL
jgi:hypothetical protein